MFLTITNCKDKEFIYHKSCGLCDSNLNINFVFKTDNFIYHQELNFDYQSNTNHYQYPYFDTITKNQIGTNICKSFQFENTPFEITLSRFYERNSSEEYFYGDNCFYVNYYSRISYHKLNFIFIDTLTPVKIDSIQFDFECYRSGIKIRDTIKIENQSAGINFNFQFNDDYWTTSPADTYDTSDTLSYFSFDKVTEYNDTFLIIEGTFYLKVYNYNPEKDTEYDPDNNQEEFIAKMPTYIGGTFKLASKNEDVYFDYNNDELK